MAILKILTDYAFIVETETSEKIGILVNYNEGTTDRTGFEFFTPDGAITFDNMEDLEQALGEKLNYAEIDTQNTNNYTKFIDDYPVNDTDNIIDIQTDDVLSFSSFRKSTRSKKRFYPGWWVVKSENGAYLPRLTISVDIYNERNGTDLLYGPFKSYMDVTYTLKQI